MKNKFLIFGGTTEGRVIAEILTKAGIPHSVSVATEYGEEIERLDGEENLIVGRKTSAEMAECIKQEAFTHVIDATHPFAALVSAEIKAACQSAGVPYLRLLRSMAEHGDASENCMYVEDIEAAAKEISKTKGAKLFLTGSKDLAHLTSLLPDVSTVFARVLPNEDSLQKCRQAGLSGRQIIAMQGPFSKEMNCALIKEIDAKVILTKESGPNGGFDEKLEAAKECNIKAVVIRSPENNRTGSDVYTMDSLAFEISRITGKDLTNAPKEIVLAGIGPGDERFFTQELKNALKSADIIFGAGSVLDRLKENANVDVPCIDSYNPLEILDYLKSNAKYKKPLIVFSGDISLCSGAKASSAAFSKAHYSVRKISGISSIAYFAAKLDLALEETKVISSHGRDGNVIGNVLENEKLIVLPSSCRQAQEICKKLPKTAKAFAGYELGTSSERLFEISSKMGIDESLKGKCLLYIENPKAAKRPVNLGLSDDDLIRGDVPMSKEEVRALSIRKLSLSRNSVLYDIGAGTGSVSIEAALLDPSINVYSVEKEAKAVELLQKNKEKYHAENIHIIEGKAPEALDGLPFPTHVFIGGSSGGLKQIIRTVEGRNNKARIVINCVTLDTLSEIMSIIKELDIKTPDIFQLQASRYEKKGNYLMPKAMNPVYIVTFDLNG